MMNTPGHSLSMLKDPKKRFIQKRQKKHITILLVIFLVLTATLIRLILLINNWPVTNSDEAIMGIMALHISYHGEWPAMYYGQGYMGPIEAYIAAPIFHLLGPSLFSLRIGLLLFFSSFLVAMYNYTRFLYTKKFALFIYLLLCLGSKEIIARQLKAIGGYPELPLFAIAICILVTKIIWNYDKTNKDKFNMDQYLLYFMLGLIVGISIWVDLLIFPFVITGLFLLIIFVKKDLLSLLGLFLIFGFIIGIFPLIFHNTTAPFSQSTIANMAGFVNTSDGKNYSILQKMAGAFFIGIPSATGYLQTCPASVIPTLGKVNGECALLQGSWSLGYLVLWTLAIWNAITNIARERKKSLTVTRESRQKQIIEYSRLMLLVSGGITVIVYALSTLAASAPEPTARYLICLLLSIPAVSWQLWPRKNRDLEGNLKKAPVIIFFTNLCILIIILCVFLYGIFDAFADVPSAQQFSLQQTKLVQRLETLKATRIYSEYWTCNRLIFQSNEKIICSVLDSDLTTGLNRYPSYQITVQKAANPAYVFPLNSQYEVSFIKKQTQSNSLQKYQYIKYEGYSIYIPDESS